MSWSVTETMVRMERLPRWALWRATGISEEIDERNRKTYRLPAPKSIRLTVEIGEALVKTREEALKGEEPPHSMEEEE